MLLGLAVAVTLQLGIKAIYKSLPSQDCVACIFHSMK